MSLLLDQNLSRRLLTELAGEFPDATHVQILAMAESDDRTLWDYAKTNGLTIVTKDSDFVELSALRGHPPKVIWLNMGNVANSVVSKALMKQACVIREFMANDSDGVLEIE